MTTHLVKHLNRMRGRPIVLFLGEQSLKLLQAHIYGYMQALEDFHLDGEQKFLLPLPFYFFHEFVANSYDCFESTAGWCNIILEKNKNDEKKSFAAFFKLYDKFKELSIKKCYFAKLDKSHIDYHYHSEYAPKVSFSDDINDLSPLYENPIEVYLIELTSYFLCLVNTESQHILKRNMYKTKRKALKYLSVCFGGDFTWEEIQVQNINFDKELSY